MTPYYSHAGITIYHGDCRDILQNLAAFDLLCTDPPYGIGEAAGKNKSRSKLAAATDYGTANWDDAPIDAETISLCREACVWQIIFGGNYYLLPPSRCWLVWDKINSGDFADCELAWTNLPGAVRQIRHMWNGMLRQGNEPRFHPTQKPLAVMQWAIQRAPAEVKTVLDPFMGSGTALRAAKNLKLTATGIELDERYCEIAAKRLSQEVLDLQEVACGK